MDWSRAPQPVRAARCALGWGQAPALHFFLLLSAGNSWCGKFRLQGSVLEVNWGVNPGSESGTCFRTDDDVGGGYRRGIDRLCPCLRTK